MAFSHLTPTTSLLSLSSSSSSSSCSVGVPISLPAFSSGLSASSSGVSGGGAIRRGRLNIRRAAAISSPSTTTSLINQLLFKVAKTDRGVLLRSAEHKEVAELAQELEKLCVHEPVKSPLIFGEWDVVYCSNPTSPGGGYRSSIGRLVFRTNEMVQTVQSPNIVRNRVGFSLFGLLEGEVSLEGKLIVLDSKWIQVIFDVPRLKVGGLEFQYGGTSEVKLQITYVDEKIRLGKGSRGSLFVFERIK